MKKAQADSVLSADHQELEELMKHNAELMEKNSTLVEENNALLRKIHRNGVWSFWLRILWYAVLIGLPFALYFLVQDYFAALGADYEIFKRGMQEIPGLKNLNNWQQ